MGAGDENAEFHLQADLIVSLGSKYFCACLPQTKFLTTLVCPKNILNAMAPGHIPFPWWSSPQFHLCFLCGYHSKCLTSSTEQAFIKWNMSQRGNSQSMEMQVVNKQGHYISMPFLDLSHVPIPSVPSPTGFCLLALSLPYSLFLLVDISSSKIVSQILQLDL